MYNFIFFFFDSFSFIRLNIKYFSFSNKKGNNPDPSVRPHAIGNSYGCISSEGCSGDEFKEGA